MLMQIKLVKQLSKKCYHMATKNRERNKEGEESWQE